MKALDWLRACRDGSLANDWNQIRIERAGRRLDLMVSTDAAKVGGHRQNVGARGQQLLADALGAVLPTAIIMAERHRQATVKVPPVFGDIAHMTAEQHSELVDRKLMTGDYAATPGPWIVSGPGKSWTIDRLSSPTVAVAEGMLVESAYPISSYRGVPFGPAEAAGVYAARVPGAPQVRAGRHGLHQGDGDPKRPTDYSQLAFFALDACVLDGRPDKLSRVYQDRIDCALVSPDGRPLPARHPGVERLEESPEWRALLPTASGVSYGVDVSQWQPPQSVDYARLAADHQFVIARACYGVTPDAAFAEHVRRARAAGLKVGGYAFFRQRQDPQQQLAALASALQSAGVGAGDVAPAVDLETNSSGYDGPLDPAAHNRAGRALVEAVRQRWGAAVVYLSPGHWLELGKPAWVEEHHVWTAHWGVPSPAWPTGWAIWQCSASYRHPAFSRGPLDRNQARALPTARAG